MLSIASRYLWIFLLLFSLSLQGDSFSVPQAFQDGRPIKQLILISDVDGVVRDNVESTADPRVLAAVKSLLECSDVDIAFLSGTPIANDLTIELWRRGNIALDAVFGSSFTDELKKNQVSIYGAFGGHKMKANGDLEILDQFSLDTSFKISHLMIKAFLEEVIQYGREDQIQIAKHLYQQLDTLELQDLSQSITMTPREFGSIATAIRTHIDPKFRLMCHSPAIEIQISTTQFDISRIQTSIKHTLEASQIADHLPPEKQIVSGKAKRNGEDFSFTLVSRSHKGIAASHHISQKKEKFPDALIITIGDTQGDFPMHHNAHIAFHVGMEEIWRKNSLSHCMMVRNSKGEGSQHVEGTLKVLQLIKDALGKSFHDFKYIPRCDAAGQWDFYSINDLQQTQ
jgi:hypothetical protein